jgi:hypothetical protein
LSLFAGQVVECPHNNPDTRRHRFSIAVRGLFGFALERSLMTAGSGWTKRRELAAFE